MSVLLTTDISHTTSRQWPESVGSNEVETTISKDLQVERWVQYSLLHSCTDKLHILYIGHNSIITYCIAVTTLSPHAV